MKYFSTHLYSLVHRQGDSALVVGIAGGRVPFEPQAKWLYSLRVMVLFFKVEILWTTREMMTVTREPLDVADMRWSEVKDFTPDAVVVYEDKERTDHGHATR